MRWLLAAFLLAGPAAADPLLVGVAPDLPGSADGDEGFAVWASSPLVGARVTDGETTIALPALEPGITWFTGNASYWAEHDGPAATEWRGELRLGNDGDSLAITSRRGSDAFAWGDKTVAGMDGAIRTTSSGLVYMRHHDGAWVDTDSWRDWATPRMHRIGQSALPDAPFVSDGAMLYRSPDNSFDVLTALLDQARDRVHLHVYDLRSQLLGDHLVAAAARGVDVRVMVEDVPVGQDANERHETAMILERIEDAGGEAFVAGSGRYSHHHLKVLVADEQVAIQTENWVASGVPADPSWGNRGWGVVLRGNVSDWMADWMADDRAAWDTTPFVRDDYAPFFAPVPRFAAPRGSHVVEPPTVVSGPVEVRVLVSPDHTSNPATEPSAQAAAGATERLLVQQLDLRLRGSNHLGFEAPDPLFEAVVASPAPDKRVLAAGPFRHDDVGNREVLSALAAQGIAGREYDGTLHAKAFVADDTLVIGSMNANHASRSRNREVTVMLDSPELANGFAATFERDWSGVRDWSVIWDDVDAPAPGPMLFGLALLVASCFTGRRGSHSR